MYLLGNIHFLLFVLAHIATETSCIMFYVNSSVETDESQDFNTIDDQVFIGPDGNPRRMSVGLKPDYRIAEILKNYFPMVINVGNLSDEFKLSPNISNEKPDILSLSIMQKIEGLRPQLMKGDQVKGIPSIAPLKLNEEIKFPINAVGIVKADITASNILIRGLPFLNFTHLNVNILSFSGIFEVSIPKVRIEADYIANTRIFGVLPFPWTPRGHFKITVFKLNIRSAANLQNADSDDEKFQLGGAQIIIGLEDLQFDIGGLFDNGFLNSVINKAINFFSTPILNMQRQQITKMASSMILKQSNKLLQGIDINAMLDDMM